MDTNEQNINQRLPASEIKPVAPQGEFLQPLPYAGFMRRFAALMIDCLLIVAGSTFVFMLKINPDYANPLLGIGFYIYMIATTHNLGASLGKSIMKIRVQDVETGANLTIGRAILRETVGKWLSNAALSLGFFWMLWDKNKQTWHDKLANSLVIKNQ